MGLAPPVGLLLHIFLKFDPAGRLLPLQLLVLVQGQFVQLHKDLRRREGGRQEHCSEGGGGRNWTPPSRAGPLCSGGWTRVPREQLQGLGFPNRPIRG